MNEKKKRKSFTVSTCGTDFPGTSHCSFRVPDLIIKPWVYLGLLFVQCNKNSFILPLVLK